MPLVHTVLWILGKDRVKNSERTVEGVGLLYSFREIERGGWDEQRESENKVRRVT